MSTLWQARRKRGVRSWQGLAAALALGLGIPGSLHGQAEPIPAEQMFRSLDTNGDNRLSLEDVRGNNRGILQEILRLANKPNTGSVSRSEFQQVFETHRAGQRGSARPTESPRPAPRSDDTTQQALPVAEALLRLCDENSDGRLTRTEWNRLTQLWARLDANRDGVLDPAELATLSDTAVPERRPPDAPQTPSTVAPAGTPATASDRRETGEANLEGVWRGWVVRGRGEDPNSGEMEIELTIRGNRIDGRELGTNRAPAGGLGSGVFTLTGNGRSGTMDAEQTSGPETGRRYQGIYEIDGETLRWCVTARNRQRPSVMATERGNFLMILRRQ
jgi:uncharacterized protein (TIGR03067 family)